MSGGGAHHFNSERTLGVVIALLILLTGVNGALTGVALRHSYRSDDQIRDLASPSKRELTRRLDKAISGLSADQALRIVRRACRADAAPDTPTCLAVRHTP